MRQTKNMRAGSACKLENEAIQFLHIRCKIRFVQNSVGNTYWKFNNWHDGDKCTSPVKKTLPQIEASAKGYYS